MDRVGSPIHSTKELKNPDFAKSIRQQEIITEHSNYSHLEFYREIKLYQASDQRKTLKTKEFTYADD